MKVYTVDESPSFDRPFGPWLYTGGDSAESENNAQIVAQKQRISAIVGQADRSNLWVSDKTLACYFQFLAKNLQMPFSAWYPEPRQFDDQAEYDCSIVELLDPRKMLGDPFDGIFCRSQKDHYEVNLPLVELTLPGDCVNFQLLDDYRQWFWNWRAP